MGTVYWITGLSGAGKTTIGMLVYEKMKQVFPNTVFLDGDMMREVFGRDLGYTEEARRRCAMRYSRLCNMLQRQDMNVVCCTVSMFDEIREWNRAHIKEYREIYIKVSMDTLKRRDQKGLYSGNTLEQDKEVMGIQIACEEPKAPDLIVENDGERTPREQAWKILEYFGIQDKTG
mgnify:CR=1 FL=1